MIIYGLIPLRKGSTRIKNKNFIKIQRKPLFMHATQQALNSRFISKVFISTDSDKVKINNKKLFVIKRSRASSTKYASTEMVIEEFLKDILLINELSLISNVLDKSLEGNLNKFSLSKHLEFELLRLFRLFIIQLITLRVS